MIRAQDVQTLPPGEDKIVALSLGQAAPFKGQLFDNDTAMRWAFWLEQYKLRLKVDVASEQATCKAKLDFGTEIQTIQSDASTAIQKDLKERLLRSEQGRLKAEEELRHPAWYTSVEFGIVVGVVGAGAIILLAGYGMNAASK